MTPNLLTRRAGLAMISASSLLALAAPAMAEDPDIWGVAQANEGLLAGDIVLLDIRSREEWADTGVAQGAWPISLHESSFGEQLNQAIGMLEGRKLALICASGGRSAHVRRILRENGIGGTIDVTEGMLGSREGPGWIESGLPVVSVDEALAALPSELSSN